MVGGRPTLQLGLPCLALVASLASLVVAVVALVATSTSTPREEGLPLGSVVGWVPPLPTSTPPRGWLVANGSLIPRGPWGGQRTPNLGGRVLVGGGGGPGGPGHPPPAAEQGGLQDGGAGGGEGGGGLPT